MFCFLSWKVFARRQINLLTAQAWLSSSKQLEDKVCYPICQSLVCIESNAAYICFLILNIHVIFPISTNQKKMLTLIYIYKTYFNFYMKSNWLELDFFRFSFVVKLNIRAFLFNFFVPFLGARGSILCMFWDCYLFLESCLCMHSY